MLSINLNTLLKELPEFVTLVAVTKKRSVGIINNALLYGVTDIGENRIQEAKVKFPLLHKNCTKHLIGHLQKNKVKDAVRLFDYIHSVDSIELLNKINNECEKQNKKIKIFLQINISGEESKSGFGMKQFAEIIESIRSKSMQTLFKNVEIIGLMTIAPKSGNEENSRIYFKKLKKLAEQCHLKELSMGMSNDYKIAIEEGATFIRIGRRIFG